MSSLSLFCLTFSKVELKERQRRLAILRHFGELDEKRAGNDHEEVEDEYGEEEFGGESKEDKQDGAKRGKCTVAQWLDNKGARLKEERRKALKALGDLSRVNDFDSCALCSLVIK